MSWVRGLSVNVSPILAVQERDLSTATKSRLITDAQGATHVNCEVLRNWEEHQISLKKTMTRSSQQELFKIDTQSERLDVGAGPPAYRPDPDDVRARLHKILAEARNAEKLPWDRDKLLVYQTIFPQMARWLPEKEAAKLRVEFDAEMARLKAA